MQGWLSLAPRFRAYAVSEVSPYSPGHAFAAGWVRSQTHRGLYAKGHSQRSVILQRLAFQSTSKVPLYGHGNAQLPLTSNTPACCPTDNAGTPNAPLTTRSITSSSKDFWSSAAVTSQRYLAVSDLVALVISNVAGSLMTALFSRSPVERGAGVRGGQRLHSGTPADVVRYRRSSFRSTRNSAPRL